MILVFNILLVKICAAVDDADELQVHAETDVGILELRHNITDDYDGSGGLPYRYREKFLENGIIPDVITLAPKNILKVMWGWKSINLGTKMLAEKLEEPPRLSWPTEKGVLYTLLMIAPDLPTREMPLEREWIYWRVGNIPENNIDLGDVIDEYCKPPTGFERSPRRFVLLIYRQPMSDKRIKFEEVTKRDLIFHERAHFSTLKFAEKYGFDIYAHAGNFFFVHGSKIK